MEQNEVEGGVREGVGRVKDAFGGLTGDVGTQAEGKVDQASGKLQRKFGNAADQVGDAAEAAKGKVSEIAGRVGTQVKEVGQKVGPKAAEYGEQISDAALTATRAVGRGVEQQPLLALAIAGVVGYAIGFLAHSQSSPFAPEPPLRRAMTYARRFR